LERGWAEFNDDFRPHEIPYFQRHIERDGEPALDVACGTGRLLIPYLRAGLDVDGCDVSADMVALCREKAVREGLTPTLFVQAMHELDPPRRYRTIFVSAGSGSGARARTTSSRSDASATTSSRTARCWSTSSFRTPIQRCGATG
jgi:SAM-dependent methyltransferase